jgi:uncharacterized protein (TIRG00374 family)
MIAFGVFLFAFLIYAVGPASLWRKLAILGWGLVPLTLLDGVTELFHAQGWRHCLSGSHRSLSFVRVFSIRLAGSSINQLTPTAGFGGEVTKGVLLASDRMGAEAAAAVIVDKLSQALAQLLFVVGGTCAALWNITLPRTLWAALVTGTLLLLLGVTGFFFVQKYGKLGAVVRWTVAHRLGGSGLKKAALHMTQVDHTLRLFYRDRPLDLPLSIVWHIMALVWSIVPAYCFLTFLTGRASLSVAAAVICLGTWFNLVTFALPVDIGVQETARVIVFSVLGFNSALGLTYGVTLRFEQLFWAGVGLVLYGMLVVRMKGKKALPANGGTSDDCRQGPENGEAAWKRV